MKRKKIKKIEKALESRDINLVMSLLRSKVKSIKFKVYRHHYLCTMKTNIGKSRSRFVAGNFVDAFEDTVRAYLREKSNSR